MHRSSRSRIATHFRAQWAGLLALFLVIAGGTAYAANTIGSSDIIDESILSRDIKNGEVQTADIGNNQVRGNDVRNANLPGGGLTGSDILGDSLGGGEIDESALGQVPQATHAISAGLADTATTANNLERGRVYMNTQSTVVAGGSQDDSNGNGVSGAVSVWCDPTSEPMDFDAKDVAIGGGAYWSGNPNSNSNELENRIHSAAFIDQTFGDPATSDELPAGYRVRGEVDKDGNDTLTVQVVCFPAN